MKPENTPKGFREWFTTVEQTYGPGWLQILCVVLIVVAMVATIGGD